MSTLWKKSMRDLWDARWHAAGLAALVAVAVALVAGTSRGRGMLAAARDASLQRLNAADLDIRCSPTLPGVLSRAGEMSGVVAFEERMLLDGVVTVGDAPTVPVQVQVLPAQGRPTIYALDVMQGRWPKPGEEALLLNRSYARVRSVSLGDEVELELLGASRRLPIVGITNSAEHIVHPAHPDFEVPVPGSYAIVQISAAAAKHFPYTDRVDSLLFRCAPGTDLQELASRLLDQLPVAALGLVSAETDTSRRFTHMSIATFDVATEALTVVFLLVVLALFIITITRRVRAQRMQIGTLLAVGHRPLPVALSMLGHSVVPTLAGGALGMLLHHAVARRIFDAHAEAVGWAPLVDPGVGPEGLVALAAGVFVAVVACLVPALLTASRMPAWLLRPYAWALAPGPRHHTGMLRDVLRLPISVVLGLTAVMRRRWSTLSTVIALAAIFTVVLAFWFVEVSHRKEVTKSFDRLGLDGIAYFNAPKTTQALREATHSSWDHIEPNISKPLWFEFPTGATFMRVSALEPDGWIGHFPIAEGRQFSSPSAPELYIDRWVSRTCGLGLGDRVTAFPYFSAPEGIELEVVAILGGVTLSMCTMPIETGRTLFDLPDMATSIHIASEQSRAALVRSMRGIPDVKHVTVLGDGRKHAQALFGAAHVVVKLALMLGVLSAVIFLAILAALDVSERAHDLATLRALGWRNRSILGLCVTEVATRGYLALAVALPASPFVARWVLDRISTSNYYEVPLHDDAGMYLTMAALAIVLVPLGALPAWRTALALPGRHLARLLSSG